MADGLTDAIGEALLSCVVVIWPDAVRHVKDVAGKVAEAVRPDPPLNLQTPDGQTVTGIVVLEQGRALLFFGTRQPSVSKPVYHAPERHFPEHGYPERTYDNDQSLWSSSQYGR